MPKEKVHVPVVEPKSTSYLEIKELSRTVTHCPVFKKDTVFVRVLKINRGNPAETFETEEHWEYDIPWFEKKEEKVVVKKQKKVVEKKEEVVITPIRARNSKGQFVKNNPDTPENEAWVGGKAPKPAWGKKIKKRSSVISNALTNLLK